MTNLVPFVKALGRHWLPLMGCAGFTFLGIYGLAANKTGLWMFRASIVLGAFFFLAASYRAWDEQFRERHRLESRIRGFPLIRVVEPGLYAQWKELHMQHKTMTGEIVKVDSRRISALMLRLQNQPDTQAPESVATGVSATILFHDSNGNRLFSMDARWADTAAPFEREHYDDITEILAVNFPIGQQRTLDIALKYPEDAECYAMNSDNYNAPDLRLPTHRLPPGTIIGDLRVQGLNIDCSINIQFTNGGSGQPLVALKSDYRNNLVVPQ